MSEISDEMGRRMREVSQYVSKFMSQPETQSSTAAR
jgi:hypothetical protein